MSGERSGRGGDATGRERSDTFADPRLHEALELHAPPLEGAAAEALRTWRRPPEAPREEMWVAIEARLAEVPGDARTVRGGIGGRGWGLAAAAVAVLALGVGLGRWTVPDATGVAGISEAPVEAAADPSAGRGAPAAGSPATGPGAPAGSVAREAAPVVAGSLGGSGAPGAGAVPPATAGSAAIRRVALEHLGRSESLLSLVRADATTGHLDPQVGAWGRGLLAETRLLLDSPASADPAVRALLEDLELILAQVAVLSVPEGDETESAAAVRRRAELRLIAEGMEEQSVLPRIQAVLPGAPIVRGS